MSIQLPAIHRGHIYWVQLPAAFGRELNGKRRPVVVVSTNRINHGPGGLTVIVIPGSTTKAEYRNIVHVTPDPGNGLKADTYFQCHQARAVDRQRIVSESVGKLTSDELRRIEESVAYVLGLVLK